ncbi:membrane protein [Beggiatoa sp. PS]|nr:membrane protein [Beggiatoa sp. PS]
MENINPYSTPNTPPKDLPESNVRYAGLWLRIVAALFDGFVIFLGILVLLFLILKLTGIIISNTALALLLSWLYYTLLESSHWQATLGKKG